MLGGAGGAGGSATGSNMALVSFPMHLLLALVLQQPAAPLFTPAAGRFLQVSSTDTTGGNRDYWVIPAGDSAVLLDVNGPGVVRRLWITVASPDPHYLRRIALLMYWDGETNPSVEAPLGDFFGNGFSKKHYTALPMGESSGGFYCDLPMPFRRHARIVAVNGTGRPIDAFYYNIDLVTDTPLPDTLLTFHAWWHRDRRTTARTPHLIVDAHGRGQLVGVSLNAESYGSNFWFLEGDEIWTVDGEKRGQGTGTEDYFNSGWYFDEGTYAGPYHGLIVKDDSLGRIAAYRWHIPDPVPFRDSLRLAIEHGTENQEVADYATMAYWYQTEPHAPLPPLPAPDDRRVLGVKIPADATPLDSLSPVIHGDTVFLRARVPRPDRYDVVVYPTGSRDPASAAFAVPGLAAKRVDLSSSDAGDVLAPVTLGTIRGDSVVRLVEVGAPGHPPAALLLRPHRVWAAAWNIVGPFANPRIGNTESSPALDSVYGPERDARLTAGYPGMNGATVRWKRVTAGADGAVRLNPQFTPNDWVAAYAEAFLYSPRAGPVTLLLGADDAHQLWVNGALVSSRQGRHISEPDDVSVLVPLRAGWNRILMKVADLDGGWEFRLRAADPGGTLRWSATSSLPDRTSPRGRGGSTPGTR